MPTPRTREHARRLFVAPAIARLLLACALLAPCLPPCAYAAQADEHVASALRLWREVGPALAQGDEARARTAAAHDPEAARALYRELLFDAVDARLYGGVPLAPQAAHARALVAPAEPDSASLEAKFAAWAQDEATRAGDGFGRDARGFEQLLYLYIAAERNHVARWNEQHQGAPVTARALTERALALAAELHVELAVAACASNLAFYALGERRRDDMLPHIERAAAVWEHWQHTAGQAGVAYLRGEHAALGEQWREAAPAYRRAAALAARWPELRPFRVQALNMLAVSLRNTNDQAGVVSALTDLVAEQQRLTDAAAGADERERALRVLTGAQIELGGAYAALGRHGEAGEWYARADRLRVESYQVQRAKLEADIAEWAGKLKAAQTDPQLTEETRKLEITRASLLVSTWLSLLGTLAGERNDKETLVGVAERALSVARAGNDQDKLADALYQLAKAQLAVGNYAQARAAALETLAARTADPRHKWLYNTVSLLGDIAYYVDDLREAEARYREVVALTAPGALPAPYDAAAAPDEQMRQHFVNMNRLGALGRWHTRLSARVEIGGVQQAQGNYSLAEQEYTAAAAELPYIYAAGAPDEQELQRWLAERARAAAPIRETDIVAHRQQTGLAATPAETERLQSATLIANGLRANIELKRASLLHDQGDLAAAAQAYREAITRTANVLGGAFPLAGFYLTLAQIERDRGNYEAAEGPLATSLAESQRKHDAASVAGVLGQTSILRLRQGRLAEARQLAEDALKIGRVVNSRSQLAGLLQVLGQVESAQGGADLSRAEQHLRAALAFARELGERGRIAYTLSDLGLTLERAGREQAALAAYEEAVGLVEGLAAALSKGVSAEVFSAKRGNRVLYERLIKLLVKRGRAGAALGYLERAKAKSLVEALAGAQVGAAEPRLKALLGHVRAAADETRAAEATLAAETARQGAHRDMARLAAARAQLAAARAQYAVALAELQRVSPADAGLVAVRTTDLAEIRRRLAPGMLLVEYFPTDTTLYVFTLARDRATAVSTVPVARAELARLVAQYRAAVVAPSTSAAFARAATRGLFSEADTQQEIKQNVAALQTTTGQLYNLLFAPLRAEVERADTLLLVPAAELYYLPLHALGPLQPDGSISYLIEQKRFAYLAAADAINTVATVGAGHAARGGHDLLALGNPDGSLPAAADEVKALSRIFVQADVYTGADATLARVVAKGARPIPYIHFATHGVLNSREPKESYLLLAGQPARLSVRDLIEDAHGMSFRGTRLVTLSACQTSIGGWDPSAVYSSLSRAFAKAGAPTVVASLWSVNDAATRDTMTVFYRQLAAGQPKAEAMRRAQLALLHDPRFAHPFFWAPFIVLGDWR